MVDHIVRKRHFCVMETSAHRNSASYTKISTSKWVERQRKWSQPAVGFMVHSSIGIREYITTWHQSTVFPVRPAFSFFHIYFTQARGIFAPSYNNRTFASNVYAHIPFRIQCDSVHVCDYFNIFRLVSHKSKWWCTHRKRQTEKVFKYTHESFMKLKIWFLLCG